MMGRSQTGFASQDSSNLPYLKERRWRNYCECGDVGSVMLTVLTVFDSQSALTDLHLTCCLRREGM